jgi:hypothetical protein
MSATIHPSRSQKAIKADPHCLASEVDVIWLDPAARGLPWLRELIKPHDQSDIPCLLAYTVDSHGRLVRAFTSSPKSQDAYAIGFAAGWCTCPLEGIDPQTIARGQPAEPAHPKLRQLQERRP